MKESHLCWSFFSLTRWFNEKGATPHSSSIIRVLHSLVPSYLLGFMLQRVVCCPLICSPLAEASWASRIPVCLNLEGDFFPFPWGISFSCISGFHPHSPYFHHCSFLSQCNCIFFGNSICCYPLSLHGVTIYLRTENIIISLLLSSGSSCNREETQ